MDEFGGTFKLMSIDYLALTFPDETQTFLHCLSTLKLDNDVDGATRLKITLNNAQYRIIYGYENIKLFLRQIPDQFIKPDCLRTIRNSEDVIPFF